MPQPQHIERAELREIRLGDSSTPTEEVTDGKRVKVQFNPQTMRVAFSNQKAGGDQRGGGAIQFVGKGATTLNMDLWFDVTEPVTETEQGEGEGEGETIDDVRKLTQKVAYFMQPPDSGQQDDDEAWTPPGVRLIWGSFLFDGVMESLTENIEFFSADGRPLRASVSVSLSRQAFQFEFNPDFSRPSGANTAGTRPQTPARDGDSVQKMAARSGRPNDWKQIAANNDIENPRRLQPGALLNMNNRR